jgi:putative effector of murein hydrolase LrgA (UPF0299 family)
MPISSKVAAGTVAGAATVVLVWALTLLHVDVPATVQGAFIVLLSFAAGWITPPDAKG